MQTLLSIIEKAANSVSTTVPATSAAIAHRMLDHRTKNSIMPWISGRKPVLHKTPDSNALLDDKRRKYILSVKRRSVPPNVVKASQLNYSQLGQQPLHPGISAFNRLVGLGLSTMPQSSFGGMLGRGLRSMRTSSSTIPSASTAVNKPETPTFWGELLHGRPFKAVDAYNAIENRKSWGRRLGEGAGAGAQGGLYFVPGVGWKARVAMGAAGSTLPGPSFEQRMVYAPIAATKAITSDIPEMASNLALARRQNLSAAETDPNKQRMNSFKRWMESYRNDPEVIAANVPRLFPDLWRRWKAGERW